MLSDRSKLITLTVILDQSDCTSTLFKKIRTNQEEE